MATASSSRTPTATTEQPWAQTSFLGEDAPTTATAHPSRGVLDALGAADHADDPRARRAALDRLAAQLTDQARQRGRSPVPKRAS